MKKLLNILNNTIFKYFFIIVLSFIMSYVSMIIIFSVLSFILTGDLFSIFQVESKENKEFLDIFSRLFNVIGVIIYFAINKIYIINKYGWYDEVIKLIDNKISRRKK